MVQFPIIMFPQAFCLMCSDGNKLVLEGQHNFDAKWVSELQSNGSLVSHLFFFLPLPLCGVHYYYVGVGHITLLQL